MSYSASLRPFPRHASVAVLFSLATVLGATAPQGYGGRLPQTVARSVAPPVAIPMRLHLFAAAVYEAERGIDGALLLTAAQQAQIGGLTEAVRDEEARLDELARKAATREQRLAAAKERAKFDLRSRARIRGLVLPVLTREQAALVARVDAVLQEAVAEVEADFQKRLAGASGTDHQELERARPSLVTATFASRLDAFLDAGQQEGVATRAAAIRRQLQQDQVRAKARELARRKAEERARRDAREGFGSFDADAVRHEWANAYLLSLAAHYAYPKQLGMAVRDFDDHEQFEDLFAAKLMPMGIDEVEFFTADDELTIDAEAVVFSNDEIVVVAFRGSEGLEENTISGVKDWVGTNANFRFTRLCGYGAHAAVHTGIWNASSRIYRVLAHEIARQGGARKKVWLTGHSLGGGMATAFAARHVKNGGKVQGIVTFAAPRVGNGDFNEFVQTRVRNVQRWVHKNDLIPMLPPDLDLDPLDNLAGYSGPNGCYLHFGQTNNIRKNGNVVLDDAEIRVPGADWLLGDVFQHYSQYYCRGIFFNMPAGLRQHMPPPPPKP